MEKIADIILFTPYSFRPKVAKKYVLESHHDFGQGILECIYDVHQELTKSDESNFGTEIFGGG